MNNANMVGMNNMGGPVGGGGNLNGPMMNNGAPGRMPPNSMSNIHPGDSVQRAHLNTYIYEYFIKFEMVDCAKAMLASKQPLNLDKNSSRRRDENGINGVNDDMDTDSKDFLMDIKRVEDLPPPMHSAVSEDCPDACFLFDWWNLFWDMFNGQQGKSGSGRENIVPFIQHTQHQTKLMQDRQTAQLQRLNPAQQQQHQMMNNQQQYIMRNQSEAQNQLRLNALRNQSKAGPQMMLQQHKQSQLQNGAEMDGNRQRAQSPGSGDSAPSPSKRQRLDNGPFPNQPGMANGGRGQPQGMPGQEQMQNFANGGPGQRNNAMSTYSKNLSQQQKTQIPNGMTPGMSPANQGSPMVMPENAMFDPNYNTGGPGGRGGPAQNGPQSGNHALQDYQMQLMLLEQQNKKRLMMARQEQDSIRPDGGPGQQYQGASPNGARSGVSPNPNDMKRGTPQMGNAGIPGGPGSPLPDGPSRNSPAMGFNPNHMDPTQAPTFYGNGAMKGLENAGMVQMQQNGMRPPSSHPPGYNPQQMTPQQMMQRQQQQQQGNNPFPGGFQPGGPNGAMMIQQQSQGGGPQAQGMGTPQQRNMPPPQVPAAGNAPNGQNNNRSNTQPSSPQQTAAPPTPSQTNKAAPGKGKKNDEKPRKQPRKKGSVAALNSGATPSADGNAATGNDGGPVTTPTPATPVTPLHPSSFKNGQGNQQGPPPGSQQGGNNSGMNGQQGQQGVQVGPPPQSNPIQAQQPLQQAMEPQYMDVNMDMSSIDFSAGFGLGGPTSDVLEHFDFDSFLNEGPGDNADGGFNFDTNFSMEGEVGAE